MSYFAEPDPARDLEPVGLLRALVYTSDFESPGRPRTYIHFMQTWPRLMRNREGNQLYIVGGRYRVTPRGITG